MPEVTKTELNQQTAKVLARVAAGERLTVTDRGRPIAQLSPPEPTVWEQLVASGKVRFSSRTGPLSFDPVESDVSVAEILDDIRADRL